MSHPGFLAKLLSNLKVATYTSNDTAAMYTDGADSPNDRRNVSLPGLTVMLPDETESSLNTGTLGIAEISDVATPRYSKHPSDKFKFSAHFSFV